MTSTYLRCYVVWQRWDASQQWLLQCGVLAAGRNPSSIHRQIKESPRQLTWTRTPHQRAATSPRHNPSERLPSLGLKWCCHTNIYGRCPVWRWCALDEVIYRVVSRGCHLHDLFATDTCMRRTDVCTKAVFDVAVHTGLLIRRSRQRERLSASMSVCQFLNIDCGDMVEIETRCRIPTWRTFGRI